MDPTFKRQPYSYDTQVYLWTTVYSLAIILLTYGCIVHFTQWWSLAVLVVILVMSLYFVFAMPCAFEETEYEYIVHLLMFKKRFAKSEFCAESVSKDVLKDTVRTFATGGAFGYTGYWWSPALKSFYCMVANVNSPLLLLTRKDTTKKPRVFLINGTLTHPAEN